MNGSLSAEVKQALQDIYYNVRTGRGKEAFALLERASAAGDGDASCVLARCYCGYQYVWAGHNFPEDDRKASKLLHKSVEQGSALGVLVALRSRELTPSVQKKMPFASLQEAFDKVEAMAREGDAFCQYVVGNSYFWWDFLRIQNKGKDSFPNQAAYKAYLKEQISKCEDWFWESFRGGVHYAGNNLDHFYTKGNEDIIAPQPEKAKDLNRIGAELGYPTYQYAYARDLKEAEQYQEAFHWFHEAAVIGTSGCWAEVGFLYWNGWGTEQDRVKAVECFEKELAINPQSMGGNNYLGRAYFLGDGIPQDFAKAIYHLNIAHDARGSKWGSPYLAQCYYNGWGVPQDYGKALQYLNEVTWKSPISDYYRGCIYGRGLGVTADIPKAVNYLQSAGNLKQAKEELLHYKKALFGKWVRR